jgi:radical SAM protein with 4Fe4S-binding SPASM domain
MSSNYLEVKSDINLPRLPLEGYLDLTYRCNNNCRHCWLKISSDSPEVDLELNIDEIKRIAAEARALGCRKWSISGGEPMLRPDFVEIFDYITNQATPYSLNTNGTLITPKIAKAMKRRGSKMVALYGATAEVHDHITRNPGSFKLTMRGFKYLKEAGAGFIVQVIPMRDNYHEFQKMVRLAESLSRHWRIGASWLHLSASRDEKKNEEIIRQRLSPEEVIELDKQDVSYEDGIKEESHDGGVDGDGYLFTYCIKGRRDFHIDPYGQMTFCSFVKDPALRYDLRKGNFKEGWENFIPSLKQKVKIAKTNEGEKNCASCQFRADCRWCPVYSYLEHGDFDAKVDYLCTMAKANKAFKEDWHKNHRRYYRIADMTIQVESDLPIKDDTFHPKFRLFAARPDGDLITIRHHFYLPNVRPEDLGKEVYRKVPWAIYKKNGYWVYSNISPIATDKRLHKLAVFNEDYTRATIYNPKEEDFLKGNSLSLTLFPTDQVLLACTLANREGCYLHSCGVNFGGKGLLFVGHSEAGKSTMAMMLKGKAEILCDDRIIIRRRPDGFKIYGTWSHGDVSDISPNSAPLTAIMFLRKADGNRLTLMEDKKKVMKELLECLIRPLASTEWWKRTIGLLEGIVEKVPCYILEFDKSGRVVDTLKQL